MANTPESISHIKIGNEEYPIDAVAISGKSAEQIGELVTSIDGESTDMQYPSAKCMYEIIYGSAQRQTLNNTWNGNTVWDGNTIWQ